MTKNEIIDFCLDNGNLSNEELVSKLSNKLSNEQYVPFNHEDSDVVAACGLKNSKIISGNAIAIAADKEVSTTSELVEYFENNLTKRELAFVFVSAVNSAKELYKTNEQLKELLRRLM